MFTYVYSHQIKIKPVKKDSLFLPSLKLNHTYQNNSKYEGERMLALPFLSLNRTQSKINQEGRIQNNVWDDCLC